MRLTIQQKVQAGFVVALLFLVSTGAISFWTSSESINTIRLVNHSYQILTQLKDTLAAVLNIETATRAYVVAGDEAFLEPQQQGLKEVQRLVQELRQLVADNPRQQHRLAELEPLISQKIAQSDRLIAMRRAGNDAGAARLLAQGEGKQFMDRIRQELGDMVTEEQRLLRQRLAKEEMVDNFSKGANIAVCVLALGLVGLAIMLLRRDFQKREQAEAERDRFFTLSLDMLCIANADGYFKRISPAFTTTLGWRAEEILARPFLDFVHPDDREATRREVERQVAAGEKVLQFENRYQHKDGSWRVLSWKSVPQPGGFMYATARDVTERKLAEQALEQARQEAARERERLQFIFDSAPVGISFSLTEGDGRRLRLINDAHLRICGLTREQAGEPGIFKRITHPEDQRRQNPFTVQIEDGTISHYSLDKRYVRLDGQTVWVMFSFQRRKYDDGRQEDLSIVVDITERKQMEESLLRSEENLSVTLQSIGDAVLATDPEGRITRMNTVAEKLTGWSMAEAQGRPIADVFHIINEKTRQPAVIPVDKVLTTGMVQGLANHTVIIARDGTEHPIADSAAPIRDRQGRTLGVVLVFRDVTEEKKAERAIHDSEERLRALNDALEQRVTERTAVLHRQSEIISSANDAIIVLDYARDTISFWNQGAERLYGWTKDEVLGRVIHTFLQTKFPKALAEINADFLQDGHWQGELKHMRRGGSEIIVMSSWTLQRDGAGTPVSRLQINTDITERKRAEAALNESERFARATLDALTAHVAILDEQGVIIATNQTWQEFARKNDLSPALAGPGVNYFEACVSAAGQSSPALMKTAEKMAQGIREVIAGQKKEFTLEYDCHSPTEKQWFHCRVTRFPGNGRVRVVVAHENVTQMKLLERQQIRNQRMESLGTLAGGVAHDLNNALAPILVGVELLKEQYPNDSEIVDMFQTSAQRGAGMVRQLLTFAKGAEGARISIQPAHLLKEMRGIITGTFPKNIHLELHYEKKLPTVLGDPTQLHQVLLNLCVNARDAMPYGGTLTLEAEQRILDEVYASAVPDARAGKYFVLRVRDTGVGIPPEIVDRIFDPFFTTKGPDKGTGLGLSTVMGIVKGHGGFIQVYSQPGKGSTFAVYLPADNLTGDTELLVKPATEFRGNGETILLVDDEPAVREVGRAVLRRLNFNPLTAVDGADGLVQMAEHRADLRVVITDLHMPHMDGLALVRALRRMLPHVPVVVASGRMDDAAKDELEALDVTLHLDKPFTSTQLSEVLKIILAPK